MNGQLTPIGSAFRRNIQVVEVENGFILSYSNNNCVYQQHVFLDIHTLTEKIKELLKGSLV